MNTALQEIGNDMKEISRLLKTQNNRITADPIFIVQQKVRDCGYDSGYSDDYVWIRADEYYEADEDEMERLDEMHDMGEEDEMWNKVYYRDRWEFVTACFTEQGCKDYIACNGHNLNSPRIYAASGYRNDEWINIRKYLMDLAQQTTVSTVGRSKSAGS